MSGHKLGIVGVGQSPRVDILPGMRSVIGKNVEVIEKGVLDGLSIEEIRTLHPRRGITPICTRLADGTQVVVAEEAIIPRVQAKIDELNEQKVELIVLLCTGHFPRFKSSCLVLESQKIVDRCVEAVASNQHSLGVLVPLPEQVDSARQHLSHITPRIAVRSASPYGPKDGILQAAESLKTEGVDLVVMHCMGYRNEHRSLVRQRTGKPAILSNSIVARTAAELIHA